MSKSEREEDSISKTTSNILTKRVNKLFRIVRDSSKSRERPGECRKSREEEKPVFEEDPDE